MIPYGRQDITEEDIRAVVDVLRSDFLTQGPAVPAFEAAVAAWCGAAHAVAVNSATSALHLACLALGVGLGDRVWTVPNTFVASANCALYCGAAVDFVDIDPDNWNISVPALSEKLEAAAREHRLPKVLIPVHFAGQPTAQKSIHELSRQYGFQIIEDASHAVGASGEGGRVGNCRWSDITVFSFHPVKIVTSAEGGMALTNDAGLAEKMALLRSHGITRDAARLRQPAPGGWYYEQQSLGFNYRLTDLQAALGLSQFSRLEAYVDRRNLLAGMYRKQLSGLPLACQKIEAGNRSAYHLFVVRFDRHGDRPARPDIRCVERAWY
jgi:UDP-4-amino-4,6-dideoxy-N-acetyl-beta-L-altrosamine transaminase